MADNFVTCANNFLTLETLLAALIDLHTATGCYGVRVCESYEDTCTEVPQCASFEDFLSLFRRAIAIGADGRPAIRTIWDDHSGEELADLEPGATCGQENFWENLAKRIFTFDADGNVAIQVFDVCASRE